MVDNLSVIAREHALADVEERLHDLIPDNPALPEEWWADQADEIVEMVADALNYQGAVEDRRALAKLVVRVLASDLPISKAWKSEAEALLDRLGGE